MRKLLIASALVSLLAGCAANSPYGNYSKAPAAVDRAMATDTVAHLVKFYPPALTRWNIMQPGEDAYGKALVELLRARGYSVMEFAPDSAAKEQASPQKPSALGVDLRYVVDSLAPVADMYRVTIFVGSQPISRAYLPQQNGTVSAAGSWARKE
ncbi:conjugal transfer protein TrbH [Pseudomonas syringae]|uniref:conjugal transfer protein TrbH n=1 Tax=Pseudomonas syringae TaxID=317 RepID=UPI0002098DE6|nr:conjugal transfer protein TrbH [Pseudomonas syringae]MDP5168588.1 conjugal transfer protein TrbH [Pseudomonas syringae pv. aptata str. DSM 50252]